MSRAQFFKTVLGFVLGLFGVAKAPAAAKAVASFKLPSGRPAPFVSYNFKYVATVLEGPAGVGGTYRFKAVTYPTEVVKNVESN